MHRPVTIKEPFATPEEVAQSYGISERRAAELRKMVEDSLRKKGYRMIAKFDTASTRDKDGARGETASSRLASATARVRPGASARVKSKSGTARRKKSARAKAKRTR